MAWGAGGMPSSIHVDPPFSMRLVPLRNCPVSTSHTMAASSRGQSAIELPSLGWLDSSPLVEISVRRREP